MDLEGKLATPASVGPSGYLGTLVDSSSHPKRDIAEAHSVNASGLKPRVSM